MYNVISVVKEKGIITIKGYSLHFKEVFISTIKQFEYCNDNYLQQYMYDCDERNIITFYDVNCYHLFFDTKSVSDEEYNTIKQLPSSPAEDIRANRELNHEECFGLPKLIYAVWLGQITADLYTI